MRDFKHLPPYKGLITILFIFLILFLIAFTVFCSYDGKLYYGYLQYTKYNICGNSDYFIINPKSDQIDCLKVQRLMSIFTLVQFIVGNMCSFYVLFLILKFTNE